MKITKHMKTRMNQRAISQDLVDLTMSYGEPLPDGKVVLTRKATKALMDAAAALQQKAQRAFEKGGVVVVLEGSDLITTYRLDSYQKGRRRRNMGLNR
jgi:hypothetical protein